jgi:O-antigen/teichoic acid export membrane protein
MVSYWSNFKKKIIGQKDLASVGFANIVGSGISAIFWLYLASIIEPTKYGEIHYFIAIAAFAQIISLIGSSNVLTVYTAKKIKIQATLFFISLLIAVVSTIVIIVIFFRFDAGLLVLGYVIFEMINAVLLGRKNYIEYSKYFLTQKILMLVFGIGFYYLIGFDGVLYGLVLSFVPYTVLIFREFKETKIDFSLLKSRKGFIASNYAMDISGRMGSSIDKLIVAPLLGFALLGNYSLALQFFIILYVIPTIIFKYLLPQDASNNPNNKLKQIAILLSVAISVFGIIVFPHIISNFFPKFIEMTDAIQIMSIAIIPAMLSMIYTSKLLGLEKSKFVLISKIIATSSLIIGFIILGPILGIVGLASVFVLTAVFEASFLFSVTKIKKLI